MAKRILLLCFLMIDAVLAVSSPTLSKPNCTDRCGNITIPYPFGIDRSECFWDEWYHIDCRNGTIPYLKNLNLQVLNISLAAFWKINGGTSILDAAYVTVNFPIIYSNPNCSTKATSPLPSLKGSPFALPSTKNVFTAVGCNVSVMIRSSDHSFVGCELEECSGGEYPNTCRSTEIPMGLQTFTVDFINNKSKDATGINDLQCSYAFLANESWLQPSLTALDLLKVDGYAPVVLIWGISNTSDLAKALHDGEAPSGDASDTCISLISYDNDTSVMLSCGCYSGFHGNPYLVEGCQDIDECEDTTKNRCPGRCVNTQGSYDCVDPKKTLKLLLIGIGFGLGGFLLVFLSWWLYQVIKKRKEKKLREKYFKRNGGLILQQQLLSSDVNVQKGKIFNKKDMEMATENFSESRVLGKGGQGTVYKGMLSDGKIVAIKRALFLDEEKVGDFINEVMILTQISHRNIVQLLGCCLETEIPLLVYEFMPNGNLYEYLHGSNKEDPVSWEVRLQLAIEIAGALFYLHSAASIPVYHRDIKSTNILLDEKYQARIADFGTSRSISFDQTHVTTLIQGTIGYLDPEFFQTNQFTDKSDVYSFGVVLVELLTRQKPISTLRMEEGTNLAAYFILSMEDGHLYDILDAEILNQGTKEEIFNVANLAKGCLHFHGRNRPTMREVTIELERIKKLRHFNIHESQENRLQVQSQDTFRSASSRFTDNANVTASLDVQPLLLGRS